MIIEELSLHYTHTYHLGVFVCCREAEKLRKEDYSFISTLQAKLIVEQDLQSLLKSPEAWWNSEADLCESEEKVKAIKDSQLEEIRRCNSLRRQSTEVFDDLAIPAYNFDRSNKIKTKHLKRFKKIIRPEQFAAFMRKHTFVRGHHRPGNINTRSKRKRGIIHHDDVKFGSPIWWKSKADKIGGGTIIDLPDLFLDERSDLSDSNSSESRSNDTSEDEPVDMF